MPMLLHRLCCGDADDYADASLLDADAVELQMCLRRRCQSNAVACASPMRRRFCDVYSVLMLIRRRCRRRY
jgi:hypothetical protein